MENKQSLHVFFLFSKLPAKSVWKECECNPSLKASEAWSLQPVGPLLQMAAAIMWP